MADTNDQLHALSAWIDAFLPNQARDPQAQLWGRIAKVAEESGEVIAALVAATNMNPRKQPTPNMRHVEYELLDVAATALCALAHLHGNDPTTDVTQLLVRHVDTVTRRAGLA